MLDTQTGVIYVSGAYPAPRGGTEYSQRFVSASKDGGLTFGTIFAYGSKEWPERWDGDLAAARGELALSYIADATPDPNVRCLCAVVGISHDEGRTIERHLVASADDLDLDTMVHYPEVTADPAHKGRFAIALIGAGKKQVAAYISADDGNEWLKLAPKLPADVVTVSRPAVAFSPRGLLVLAWRGYHADGSYDIYAAASAKGNAIGDPVKLSTQPSHLPEALMKTYANSADFHTSVAASAKDLHVAWSDARTGQAPRVYYGRAPLQLLRSK